MADGSSKAIEALQKGDLVLAYDEISSATKPAEILKIHTPYLVNHYYVLNQNVRITEFHPVLSKGKWVGVGELKVGDTLTLSDGSDAPIFSIKRMDESAKVYNIQTSSGTYVAHGIIVHNKEDCLDYEQYHP